VSPKKKAAPATRGKKTAKKTTQPLVAKQPQSKQQAAVAAGMFLYTDDAWSSRYFDSGDLRCEERELFG
jgi:hypothetical protein